MYKPIFREDGLVFNDEANDILREISNALTPIFEAHKDISPRSLEYLVTNEASLISAQVNLRACLKNIKEKREANEKA